jgi:hypothetical protein
MQLILLRLIMNCYRNNIWVIFSNSLYFSIDRSLTIKKEGNVHELEIRQFFYLSIIKNLKKRNQEVKLCFFNNYF